MCELLGISSDTLVRPVRYLKTFRLRGQEFEDGQGNPDGWGIALYPDGRAVQVIKEPILAASSRLSEFLSTYEHLYSKIFIAHIRKASRGKLAYSNTHPFSREVQGKDYAFAHNGTIRGFKNLSIARHKPVGSTDSERLFCHLLNFIERRNICDWSEDSLLDFWKLLIGINRRPTKDEEKPNKLNLLLSDGETLIAYSDFYGMGALHRLILRVRSELVLNGSNSSPGSKSEESREESVAILATRPIGKDKGWVSMGPGELCAIRNGVQVFSTQNASTFKVELAGHDSQGEGTD